MDAARESSGSLRADEVLVDVASAADSRTSLWLTAAGWGGCCCRCCRGRMRCSTSEAPSAKLHESGTTALFGSDFAVRKKPVADSTPVRAETASARAAGSVSGNSSTSNVSSVSASVIRSVFVFAWSWTSMPVAAILYFLKVVSRLTREEPASSQAGLRTALELAGDSFFWFSLQSPTQRPGPYNFFFKDIKVLVTTDLPPRDLQPAPVGPAELRARSEVFGSKSFL